jgi:predicted nucleic acid-binding protein
MTEFVETDFLIALVKENDWLGERAQQVLADHDVVTAPYAYLEVLIVRERHEFDYVVLVSNLLDLVPVGSDEETQIVLKAVNYYDDGMTPFDAFHAATAETRGLPIRSSDRAYDDTDVDRVPLEPDDDA